MTSKRGLPKVDTNKTHWQSTPSTSRAFGQTKDTFEDRMPFSDPPSPVLLPDQQSSDGGNSAATSLNSEGGKNASKKHTTIEMIATAIEALGAGRKGSSVPAIKKWILGNYIGTESGALNIRIRKALLKGLETGVIDRATKSAQLIGAKGFFVVKPKPKAKPVVKKRKSEPKKMPAGAKRAKKGETQKSKKKDGHVSDSEVTIIKPDRRKSAKLHVSDTDLPADSTVLQMKTKSKKAAEKVAPKAKKQEKPKAEKKISRQKADEEKKTENRKAAKPGPSDATTKDKKAVEKLEAKKKEKPTRKAAPKSKKGGDDLNNPEPSTSNKKSSRNK